MELVWLTDIHMNFVPHLQRVALYEDLAAVRADAILVGGDIAESHDFADELLNLARINPAPVYFVLGNHDYYRSSIRNVRKEAAQLSDAAERLFWLPQAGVVPLNAATSLIGHGGWGDGRAGSFADSTVILNDYLMIEELRQAAGDLNRMDEPTLSVELFEKLNALGDECAAHFESVVPQALSVSDHVIVLMHVPPFPQASWHEGRLSDDNWAPHFVCKAAGEVLKQQMQAVPEKRMTVLCGHTHGEGRADILPNLHVRTAGATYSFPERQSMDGILEDQQ